LYLHAKFRGITFKDKDVESQENVGVISSEESPLLISLPNGHFPFPKVAVVERFDCITLIKITKKKTTYASLHFRYRYLVPDAFGIENSPGTWLGWKKIA